MISEIVQKEAPTGAKWYRLQMKFSDGTARYYPTSSDGYVVGQAPVGTPPGRYNVCYYDGEGQPIALPEPVGVALGLEPNRGNPAQIGLNVLNASGPSSSPTPGSLAPTTPIERRAQELLEAEKRSLTTKLPAPAPSPPLSPEAELEFRRHQHAMDMEDRQQEFIKSSTYVTEIGEIFELNRVMRREMLEMQRIIVQQSQQAHKDLDLMKNTLRDLFKLQQEALDKAAEMLPRPPPPPPPDYVGLGHTALNVLRELGVALIDRHREREGTGALRGSSKAQLPAATVENKDTKGAKDAADAKDPNDAKDPKSSSGPAHADIVERMIRKIQSASDLDMAIAMSSPAHWKALMEDLLAKPAESTEPASAQAEPAATPKPAETSQKA